MDRDRLRRTVLTGIAASAIVLAALPAAVPARGAETGLTAAFAAIRSGALWPVEGGTRDAITSTFGPRIKASSDAYDWHRGLDLHLAVGTPIVAPVDGTLFAVRTYTDGGLTVVLRHRFPSPVSFGGRLVDDYFTYYMHLDSVAADLVAADAAGETPSVPRGRRIGTGGESGSTVSPHLHWELRVGTPYSLEWQLANPGSRWGSAAFGFDPHVHPMLLAVPAAKHLMTLRVMTKPTTSVDGLLRLTTDDDQPLADRFVVRITRRSDNAVVAAHTLDLDERTGFDARSTAALDTPDRTAPWLSPVPFGSAAPYIQQLVLPSSWIGARSGSAYRTTVTVTDIWGRSVSASW